MATQEQQHPIIVITCRGSRIYPSVAAAVKDTGISKQRLLRGLKEPDGFVSGARGAVYVDEVPDILVQELANAERQYREETE